jgi:hypothetical protein
MWIVTVANTGSAPADSVSVVLSHIDAAEVERDDQLSLPSIASGRVRLGTLLPGDVVVVRAWGTALPELLGSTGLLAEKARLYSLDGEGPVQLSRTVSAGDYTIIRIAVFLAQVAFVFGTPFLVAFIVHYFLAIRSKRKTADPAATVE